MFVLAPKKLSRFEPLHDLSAPDIQSLISPKSPKNTMFLIAPSPATILL
jgi:hypothetical protein